MKPDQYYGEVAEHYDERRQHTAQWQAEQAAVERLVTQGPVIDAPFGTGRFVPHYQAKRLEFRGVDISNDMLNVARLKYEGIDAQHGSVFALPAKEQEFTTAVCVRFLEWLPLEGIALALKELQRVAGTVICTLHHGRKREANTFVHELADLYGLLDGLFIEAREVVGQKPGVTAEVFKLRPATWDDVLAQFKYDYPDTAGENIQRLADKFAGFFGLEPIPVNQGTMQVRAEYWTAGEVGFAVNALSAHRFATKLAPRADGPLTIIERDGYALMIDGRKRANAFMKGTGRHPVLVLRNA